MTLAAEAKGFLASLGGAARKSLGQNFMVDAAALKEGVVSVKYENYIAGLHLKVVKL